MPQIIDGEELLTAKEAAERKGIGKGTILKALSRGSIPVARTVANVQLIRVADVDAYKPGSYRGVERAHIVRRVAKQEVEG